MGQKETKLVLEINLHLIQVHGREGFFTGFVTAVNPTQNGYWTIFTAVKISSHNLSRPCKLYRS